MPWCLIARQRSLCSNVSCVCLCWGKEEGITGYGKKPCFSPGSHTSWPKLNGNGRYITNLLWDLDQRLLEWAPAFTLKYEANLGFSDCWVLNFWKYSMAVFPTPSGPKRRQSPPSSTSNSATRSSRSSLRTRRPSSPVPSPAPSWEAAGPGWTSRQPLKRGTVPTEGRPMRDWLTVKPITWLVHPLILLLLLPLPVVAEERPVMPCGALSMAFPPWRKAAATLLSRQVAPQAARIWTNRRAAASLWAVVRAVRLSVRDSVTYRWTRCRIWACCCAKMPRRRRVSGRAPSRTSTTRRHACSPSSRPPFSSSSARLPYRWAHLAQCSRVKIV